MLDATSFPACGHSSCRQNWIDTAETDCTHELPVECECEGPCGGCSPDDSPFCDAAADHWVAVGPGRDSGSDQNPDDAEKTALCVACASEASRGAELSAKLRAPR